MPEQRFARSGLLTFFFCSVFFVTRSVSEAIAATCLLGSKFRRNQSRLLFVVAEAAKAFDVSLPKFLANSATERPRDIENCCSVIQLLKIVGILRSIESVHPDLRLLKLALAQRLLLIVLFVLPADEQTGTAVPELFKLDNHSDALLHGSPRTTRMRGKAGQSSTAGIIGMQI
jgi:hypothetical protein